VTVILVLEFADPTDETPGMANPINLGGTFPILAFNTTDGRVITLPDDIQTPYAVVLFYRGHW
jgi:hypothetical protein